MDREYGNTIKLSRQRVGDLERFDYSEEARTDGDKLLELHRAWRDVYLDLAAVGKEGDLNAVHILVGFVKKFPDALRRGFVRSLDDASNEGLDESVVLDKFLAKERKVEQRLKLYEEDENGLSSMPRKSLSLMPRRRRMTKLPPLPRNLCCVGSTSL